VEVWKDLPAQARKTIRDKKIKFFVIDGFKVAKPHAPTPELETRMMGIAFIGAVCGHVDRIVGGVSHDAMLAKIREDLTKKFGAKGGAVVEGNLTVIREAFEATQKVDYTAPEFAAAEKAPAAATGRSVAISASMCRAAGQASSGGIFDRQYYDDIVAGPFRDGTIAEAPVLPGTGLFMPSGSAAFKDKGLFRRDVPEYIADLCTGCMECALVCPDAAIPNTVHDIHALMLTAIAQLDIAEPQREALRDQVHALSDAVRETYRHEKEPKPFHEIVAAAAAELDIDNATLRRNLDKLAAALAVFPVAKTRPFFDAMEKAVPGSGGLYSAAVDPWKCSGCLECIDVCGPHALVERHQDAALLETLQARFEFLSRTPNTPARFFEGATKPGGDTKRLTLDRNNYYATTGGHGACRGCGEVTAIRLVTSANHAIHDARRKVHIREVEDVIERLNAKLATVQPGENDPKRRERIVETIKTLEKRLYLLESGPTGNGPASMVIANATGCSSVYASTFPFNPYNDPWVNSLFQDTPAVAKGIFEGLSAEASDGIRALRVAKLELDDEYDPQVYDRFFKMFSWADYTAEELAMLPTVISMGGDGATYDIGFGALSRLLATSTPIKVVVLNSGTYSNTGGQASTSSLTGQDSDLARFGAVHKGKQEDRKELGLIAAFHPNVFVVQSCTALQGHFMKSVMEYLNHNDSPAVLDVYAPCQAENGIGDSAGSRHGRMAVESRVSPVFVHDPRRAASLRGRFVLDGNPDADKDWTTTSIEYVEDGATKLLEVPLTPADFALTEGRFKKQFRRLAADAAGVPVAEYIDLGEAEKEGKTPFVWSTGADKKLVKYEVSPSLVHLVLERRKYWRTLQYLSGMEVAKLDADHHAELEALQRQYKESLQARESSIDSIARAMSELAASSKAPPAGGLGALMPGAAVAVQPAAPAAAEATNGSALVSLSEEDIAKCSNCKTCYQDLPELFEKTKIVVDGVPKEVGHLIPGALSRVKITPELKSKVARVAANCDSEIVHEQ
ncbi:MAG TPA: thiamine pyrophosphate-dependent enzyme, partial [Rhizomicrobium sp.]